MFLRVAMVASPYELALWEISRRVLKSEKIKFIFDSKLMINTQNLSDKISDNAPSVLIVIENGDINNNEHLDNANDIIITNNDKITGRVSVNRPDDENVLWLKKQPELFWKDFEKRVGELVEAGYPGCIGCGGPGSEKIWNEQVNRSKM